MDMKDVDKILKKISYKKGWDFSINRAAMNDPTIHLYIRRPAIDVKSGKDTELSFMDRIGVEYFNSMSELALIMWVRDQVGKFEEHEATEWFKVNGIHFEDPHPELRNGNEHLTYMGV